MIFLKKYMLFIVMIFAIGGLSACNTFKGMGQDMEEAGEAIDETAEDVEDDMDN